MKEIVITLPAMPGAHSIYIVAISFAGTYRSSSRMMRVNIMSIFPNTVKSSVVYAQMNRLLIKKEYIIVFVYIFSTICNYTIWVTSTKRVTSKNSKSVPILSKPGPEGIVINFIYSNHV